jgi:hypothetical protein
MLQTKGEKDMTNLEAIKKASGLGIDVDLVGPDGSIVKFHMNPLPTIQLAELTDIFARSTDEKGDSVTTKFLQKENMKQIFGVLKFSVENSLSESEKRMITAMELDLFISTYFKDLFNGVMVANGLSDKSKSEETK